MKRITLEKVLASLREMKHEVEVPEGIRVRALRAVDRMLAVGRPSGD
jgi:quinolinate synthase